MKPTRSLIATFTVDGEPVSKSRARFTKRGSKTYAYTPERTKAGEERVAWAFRQAHRGPPATDAEVAYRVEAHFYNGTRQRRDIDNMAKLILDGLNGVAWVDDSQVIELEARKSYVPKAEARSEVAVYQVGRLEPPKQACIRCGKEFRTYDSWKTNPKGKKYCSPACCYAHRIEKRVRTCGQCGQEFLAGGEQADRIHCSLQCRYESGRADYICAECGVKFRHEKNLGPRRKRIWCSEGCREVARQRDARECKRGHLRSEFETKRENGKRYCRECMRLRSAAAWRTRRANATVNAGEPDKTNPRLELTITTKEKSA